jgi:hypothetical protein
MAHTTNQPTKLIAPAYHRFAAVFLLILITSFASLVPGGPIETRSFAHLDPIVFWGFNAFLIALGCSGLITIYFLWHGKRLAGWSAIFVAWLYLIVFILDWAQVFPTSADSMSIILCLVEIIGAICCAYVIVFSHKALQHL